jgi:hypothetical protein
MVSNEARRFVVLAAVAALSVSCRTNRAPEVPAIASGPDYCLKDTTYVFTTVASDPDGDSVALRFDWGDSTTSLWQGWFASGETVAFTHAWSDTGDYEVSVAAQDRERTSDLSDGLKVKVAIRWPPETPGAPLGPGIGGKDTLYYFKAGADHPDGDSVSIRFAWGDDDTSDWSDFVLPGGPVEMSHSWSAADTYLVRAQARDTFGLTSPWSEPHAMIIRAVGRLRLVGQPTLPPDSSGFLIRVGNDGSAALTIGSLVFFNTPDSAFMRNFFIAGDNCGYPIPDGQPGTGPGDTVHFTDPVTVAPDLSQLVELYFGSFYVEAVFPPGTAVNVHGKHFVFRFSDGSEITVEP